MSATTSPEIRAYESSIAALNINDIPTYLDHFTEDFEWTVLPKSAGFSVNRETAPAILKAFESFTKEAPFHAKIHRIIETKEAKPTLFVQAESNGTTKAGTVWHNEYMYIVEFAPREGDRLPKIQKLTEFQDGLSVTRFMQQEAENAGDASTDILNAAPAFGGQTA
ncbi:hypothetical protein CYLTODRAFT_251133 [Cylindrobasidium torrendii FP15055 ss-10]|uniref:SnoaL-like domain-containing protein n=1 Tax=Cylindrobasidium torrendii FP15055 ss-10 TaxID=1314674 RepID=A0A0D7BF94_9AGAR|nr:hypothetical protein CYLTODRAFT_251133 [Cylindrobasidium torrendii FP15055 ss-10]